MTEGPHGRNAGLGLRSVRRAGWLLCGLAAASAAASGLERVRLMSSAPARFEFLFTGVMRAPDGQALLAFNHRGGRTLFVEPGGSVGRYRVAGYASKTNRVFKPSLNAWLNEPAGEVTLAGPDGIVLQLDQDRPLPWPGRVAWLVRLDSGAWWAVHDGDVFDADGRPVAVECVEEDVVVVTTDGVDLHYIEPIMPAEQETLARVWADHRRQEAAAREQAARDRREHEAEAAAAANRGRSVVLLEQGPRIEIRSAPRLVYGDEYRFPTAFRVCPPVVRSDGRLLQAPFVVPTRFRSRSTGVSVSWP